MTKRNKFYQIGFFTLAIAFIVLCLFVGITAIQKQMKLNLAVKMNPSIVCEIYASMNGEDGTYNKIFSNVEGSTSIGENWLISGNTLTYDNSSTDMGLTAHIKVTNKTTGTRIMVESGGAGKGVVETNGTTSPFAISIPAKGSVQMLFSQVFKVTTTLTNASVTATTNLYEIGGTYYAKTGTTPTMTLTSDTHYTNPPSSVEVTGATKGYTNGVLTLSNITGDVTVTASASAMGYTITFNANGGTGGSSQSVEYGNTYSLPTEPTYDGYEFQGWSTTAGGSVTWTSGTQKCTGATTWYAVWKALEPFTFYQYSDYTAEKSWLGNQKLTAPAARDANTHYEYFCTFGTYPQSWCKTTPDTTGLGTTSSSYSGVEVTFYADSNGENKYAQVNGNYYAFEPIRWIVLGVDTSGSIAFNGDGGATTVDTANTSSILFTDALADAGKLKIENNRIYYDENGNSTFEDSEKQTNLLLLSELALDNEYFDADGSTNQWSNGSCDVRLFLNNFNGSSMTDFATISELGQYYATEQNTNLIQRTNIKTTTYGNNSTAGNDGGYYNMFLLGSNINYDGSNTYYNWTDSYNIASYFPICTGSAVTALKGYVTPFAVANGAGQSGGSATSNTLGSTYWWLRSGYHYGNGSAYIVFTNSNVYATSVNGYNGAVRPSFILNLA